MMNSNIKRVVDAYRNISFIPSVLRATLIPENNSRYIVESFWQQRDLEREENVKFNKWSSVNVEKSSIKVESSLHSSVTLNELMSSYTRSGKLKAVLQEFTNKENKKIHFLEIWDKSKKVVNIDLKEVDKHGDVHSNSQFGSLEWSLDNKKILYVAEKKIPKSESFFKEGRKEEDCRIGDKHMYKESWGEQLVECHHPTICMFELDTKEVSTFSDIIPDDISAGQAIWCHDNETIAFIGWSNEPFRLGLIYCPIRKNAIYLLNTKLGKCIKLTDDNHSVCTPRLHPHENNLFYLQNTAMGPHQTCSKLISISLPSWNKDSILIKDPQTVVDVVKFAKNPIDFPGLFLQNLPQNCWSQDGNYLFLSSMWRSNKVVLVVDIRDGGVKRLTEEGEACVLDVRDDLIALLHSTPSSPWKIKMGKFNGTHIEEWVTIEEPHEGSINLNWSIHPFQPDLKNPDFPEIDAEYILYQPCTKDSMGLVVNPHGGPHIVNVAGFLPSTAVLCQLGYTVVQVNYRGSIGFGQNGIYSLPGRVGVQEISDVQQIATKLQKDLNSQKIFVTGGSHGGFITLHLIAQYPDFYRAASVRNPVTNVSSLFGLTDIPDWCWCEAGIPSVGLGEYCHNVIPTSQSYAAMIEKSPISQITKAKTPCLVMLGEIDRRVPPSQGREWARKYKTLGKKCKVLEYKDNCHPLNKVDAEADGFVNMVLWFMEHE